MDNEKALCVRLRWGRALLGCLLATAWLAGCQAPPEPRIKGPERLLTRPPIQHRTTAGQSAEGRAVETLIFGSGPEVILIMAAIHGNEPAGTPLAQALADHVNRNPRLLDGKTLIIMPLVNPDGRVRNTRANARGVDLNRNFAAVNRQNTGEYGLFALSEPEARVVAHVLDFYRPRRIVSIHQPLTCIDYDGPGEGLARQMAAHCDLPMQKLGAKPGSLGAYAGETLGIPTVTVELKANDHTLSRTQLWERYGGVLLAAIAYPRAAPTLAGGK